LKCGRAGKAEKAKKKETETPMFVDHTSLKFKWQPRKKAIEVEEKRVG